MQAPLVKAASGSHRARLTAIANLGVNTRPAGFGRQPPVLSHWPRIYATASDPFLPVVNDGFKGS